MAATASMVTMCVDSSVSSTESYPTTATIMSPQLPHYSCAQPYPTTPPLPPPPPPCTSSGKRKHHEVEESDNSFNSQRQSILNISMLKLRPSSSSGGSKKGEPSLRRSVLIFNTLRHIESQLQQEGVAWNPANKLPQMVPSPMDNTLDPIPDVQQQHSQPQLHPQQPEEQCLVSSVAEHQGAAATGVVGAQGCGGDGGSMGLTLCPPALETGMDASNVSSSSSSSSSSNVVSLCSSYPTCTSSTSSQQQQQQPQPSDQFLQDTKLLLDSLLNSDKLSVTSFTQLFDLDNNTCNTTTSETVPSMGGGGLPPAHHHHMAAAHGGDYSISSMSSSSSSLTPMQREADILTDIDMNYMFEHDLLTPPLSPKLQPLNAEDLMHSLPPMTPEPFSNCGSAWGYKSELHSDDLDHIMQILVGM